MKKLGWQNVALNAVFNVDVNVENLKVLNALVKNSLEDLTKFLEVNDILHENFDYSKLLEIFLNHAPAASFDHAGLSDRLAHDKK